MRARVYRTADGSWSWIYVNGLSVSGSSGYANEWDAEDAMLERLGIGPNTASQVWLGERECADAKIHVTPRGTFVVTRYGCRSTAWHGPIDPALAELVRAEADESFGRMVEAAFNAAFPGCER